MRVRIKVRDRVRVSPSVTVYSAVYGIWSVSQIDLVDIIFGNTFKTLHFGLF